MDEWNKEREYTFSILIRENIMMRRLFTVIQRNIMAFKGEEKDHPVDVFGSGIDPVNHLMRQMCFCIGHGKEETPDCAAGQLEEKGDFRNDDADIRIRHGNGQRGSADQNLIDIRRKNAAGRLNDVVGFRLRFRKQSAVHGKVKFQISLDQSLVHLRSQKFIVQRGNFKSF